MSKQDITNLIARHVQQDGLTDTGIPGVQLFRATAPIPCAPAVYEPSIIAITQGSKEAILDGKRFVYDTTRYLCCPMSMPVKAGTSTASPDTPLFGVYIALTSRVMTELAVAMDTAGAALPSFPVSSSAQGVRFAHWDADFTDALLRLVQLLDTDTDKVVLGETRLRELCYAVLKGDAGPYARQAFGAGNAIARSIAHVSSNLTEATSIDDMAARAGMSRAVFHRKFKQATTMSPIQFVKSMRLNNAAMKIAGGATINEAALDVGYISASQFSREFKRLYGQSPRQWGNAQQAVPTHWHSRRI